MNEHKSLANKYILNPRVKIRKTISHFLLYNSQTQSTYVISSDLARILSKGTIKTGDLPQNLIAYLLENYILEPKAKYNVETHEYTNHDMLFDMDPSLPTWICIRITNACPYKCKHCIYNAGKSFPHELTTYEIYSILEVVSTHITTLIVSGGEPLTRKDLESILRYCDKLGISTSLLTTGAHLSKTRAREIANFVTSIQVSIDGMAETHNWLRNSENAFSDAIKTIRLFKREKKYVSVATVLFEHNIEYLPQIAQILERLKVDRWKLQPIIPMGRAIRYFRKHLNLHFFTRLIWQTNYILKNLKNEVNMIIELDIPRVTYPTKNKERVEIKLCCGKGFC